MFVSSGHRKDPKQDMVLKTEKITPDKQNPKEGQDHFAPAKLNEKCKTFHLQGIQKTRQTSLTLIMNFLFGFL